MAATHGMIGEFNSSREDWMSYTERLQQYFTANDVADAGKQRAILLSVCGASTYQLIRNLVAPTKPTDQTFAEIVEIVQKHNQPSPSVMVQRFNFHSRCCRQGETVSAYVAELQAWIQRGGFWGCNPPNGDSPTPLFVQSLLYDMM